MRIRPRVPLHSVFLLTAVVALSIVVIRQHRELSTIRQDVGRLPNFWKARPHVLDKNKLYGIEAQDIQSLLWTWRLWVPPNETAVARFKWGDIPAEGFPDNARSIELPTGDTWLALKFDEQPVNGESLGQLFGPDSVLSFVVPKGEQLSPWWKSEYKTDVFSARNISEDGAGRLVLQRFRVIDDAAPEGAAAKGFIIWLERR